MPAVAPQLADGPGVCEVAVERGPEGGGGHVEGDREQGAEVVGVRELEVGADGVEPAEEDLSGDSVGEERLAVDAEAVGGCANEVAEEVDRDVAAQHAPELCFDEGTEG